MVPPLIVAAGGGAAALVQLVRNPTVMTVRRSFALLLAGLILVSVVVFRYVLGIPLEVWPKWI
jgi:hypothetical protein